MGTGIRESTMPAAPETAPPRGSGRLGAAAAIYAQAAIRAAMRANARKRATTQATEGDDDAQQ